MGARASYEKMVRMQVRARKMTYKELRTQASVTPENLWRDILMSEIERREQKAAVSS